MKNGHYFIIFALVALSLMFLMGSQGAGQSCCVGCCAGCCCGCCDSADYDKDGSCFDEIKECEGTGCASCDDGYHCVQYSKCDQYEGVPCSVCEPVATQEICGDTLDNDCTGDEKNSVNQIITTQGCGYDKRGELNCCDDDSDSNLDCNFEGSASPPACDIDDDDSTVFPGATEKCDPIDHDQNGFMNNVADEPCQYNATETGIMKCIAPNVNPETGGFWSKCSLP